MLCKGTGVDLGKCKRGEKPRGLGRARGKLCTRGREMEREWQGLGMGMQPGNSGGAGLHLWLKVLNEVTRVSPKLERTAVLLPVNSIKTYCQRNICAHGTAPVMAAAACLNRALFHRCEGWTLTWKGGIGREDSVQRQRCLPLRLWLVLGLTCMQCCGLGSQAAAPFLPHMGALHPRELQLRNFFLMFNLHPTGINECVICIERFPCWPPNHLWGRGTPCAVGMTHPRCWGGGTVRPSSRTVKSKWQ